MTPPLIINCFNCENIITVKYVQFTGNYSQKNNWEYWTLNKDNKGKYICDNCLVTLRCNYKKECLQLIPNKGKRTLLQHYISSGTIRRNLEPAFIKELRERER